MHLMASRAIVRQTTEMQVRHFFFIYRDIVNELDWIAINHSLPLIYADKRGSKVKASPQRSRRNTETVKIKIHQSVAEPRPKRLTAKDAENAKEVKTLTAEIAKNAEFAEDFVA